MALLAHHCHLILEHQTGMCEVIDVTGETQGCSEWQADWVNFKHLAPVVQTLDSAIHQQCSPYQAVTGKIYRL